MSKHPVRAVTVSEHIPGRTDEVLSVISDTQNDPLWCPNVLYPLPARRTLKGQLRHLRAHFAG